MGDPRKQRKKYETPSHPWQAERIERERGLVKAYGLKNKKEIWKMESFLRRCKRQAKSLIIRHDPQAKKEEKLLLQKLYKLSIVEKEATIESILDLETRHLFDRRLQTVLYKKGLARTPRQSRQFIIHQHVLVKGKKIDVPSYLVRRDEEGDIAFSKTSPLAESEHPERIVKEKSAQAKAQEEQPKVEGQPVMSEGRE